MRLFALAAGVAIGAWVGWAVGRRPRTVAQPARPFRYDDPMTWTRTNTATWVMPPDTTVTYGLPGIINPKHPQ